MVPIMAVQGVFRGWGQELVGRLVPVGHLASDVAILVPSNVWCHTSSLRECLPCCVHCPAGYHQFACMSPEALRYWRGLDGRAAWGGLGGRVGGHFSGIMEALFGVSGVQGRARRLQRVRVTVRRGHARPGSCASTAELWMPLVLCTVHCSHLPILGCHAETPC